MSLYTRLLFASVLSFCLTTASPAQNEPAKQKTPAEVAADAFFKLRDQKGVKATPERLTAVLDAGLAFLQEYATHGRANGVINSLATFGTTMRGNKLAAQRIAWLSRLQYETLRQNGGTTKNKAAPAAFKALAAAVAGQLMQESPSHENLADFRDKIDRLAEQPECTRFLAEQERAYIQLLKKINQVALAEKHATRLLASSDRRVAAMAQEELTLIDTGKQPLALAFTALDGKAVDVAALRGKPIFFLFWATTQPGLLKEIEAMQKGLEPLPQKKFAVILVNCDPEENRADVVKYVKKNGLKQPVWFAGAGLENELCAKLNITKLPATAIFDANGIFVSVGTKFQGTPGQLKKLLGIK